MGSVSLHYLLQSYPTDPNRLIPHTDQATQDQVRDKAAGRGLLYPDTFSEERLLLLPPAPSALLVIFNRNHNVRFPFPHRQKFY